MPPNSNSVHYALLDCTQIPAECRIHTEESTEISVLQGKEQIFREKIFSKRSWEREIQDFQISRFIYWCMPHSFFQYFRTPDGWRRPLDVWCIHMQHWVTFSFLTSDLLNVLHYQLSLQLDKLEVAPCKERLETTNLDQVPHFTKGKLRLKRLNDFFMVMHIFNRKSVQERLFL